MKVSEMIAHLQKVDGDCNVKFVAVHDIADGDILDYVAPDNSILRLVSNPQDIFLLVGDMETIADEGGFTVEEMEEEPDDESLTLEQDYQDEDQVYWGDEIPPNAGSGE